MTLQERLTQMATFFRTHSCTDGQRHLTAADEMMEALEHIAELATELAWYGEQARLCRLIHSEGDAGRHALAADGGKRAREVLSKT